MNKVFLSGYVVSGPELKLETGKPVQAIFQMSAWYRAEDEQWKREVYTVCCLAKRARWAMDYIRAGQRLAVEGTLLGAEKVKIAAHEIAYIEGIRRARGPEMDAKCEAGQEASDDAKENEEEATMAVEAQKEGQSKAQTETRTQGTAQSNDGIDPRQRKWYHMGNRNRCTEASRAASAQGENAAPDGKDGNKDGRFSRMKKKLLSMMLALVMALGMAVCGGAEDARPEEESASEAQEELHTLWDIPWGSTPEEVMRLAEERAGVKLYVVGDAELNDALYLDNGRQKITLLGVPLKDLTFGFEEGGLKSIQAQFWSENKVSKRQFSADGMSLIRSLYEAITLKYGALTDSYLDTSIKYEDSYKIIRYFFPEKEGKVDYALLSQILEENEDVYLDLYWYNVNLELIIKEPAGEIMGWLYWENKERKNGSDREPQLYPKRNGYLTLEEELSRTGPAVNVGI